MTILEGPRLDPLSQKPAKQLIILLHGYGADGNDLIDLAKIWQTELVDAAFISPHAPQSCELSPFGRQWFSLEQYDPDLLRRDPNRIAEAYEIIAPGAREAQPILEEFIQQEREALSLGWKDIALVGFSQGTMMSLFTGLRQQIAPAGILGYSGALVGADTLPAEITSCPPVTLVHGEEDDILPYPTLALTEQGLKNAGITVSTHTRPGLGHSIDMEGIAIGRKFLSELF